ncbi:MAG TPA: hypothetical protein VD738_00930 [Nitrospira sp.]|nr:hypothetical protein [Nitrospira sp.]
MSNQIVRISHEAFIEAASSALKLGNDQIIEMASTGLQKALAGVSGSFLTGILLALLRASAEGRLESLQRQLSNIAREAFVTGMEELSIAAELPARTATEGSWRIARFHDAVRNFDRAISHVTSEDEKALLHFFRGLATSQIPGAAAEAIGHLRKYELACTGRAERLTSKSQQERSLSEQFRQKAEKVVVPPCERGSLRHSVYEPTPDYLEKQRLIVEAKVHERRAEGFRQDSHQLLQTAAFTREWIAALEMPVSTTSN